MEKKQTNHERPHQDGYMVFGPDELIVTDMTLMKRSAIRWEWKQEN